MHAHHNSNQIISLDMQQIINLYNENKLDECMQIINMQMNMLNAIPSPDLGTRNYCGRLHYLRGRVHFSQQRMSEATRDFTPFILSDFVNKMMTNQDEIRELGKLFVAAHIKPNLMRLELTKDEVLRYIDLAAKDMESGYFSRAKLRYDFLLQHEPYNFAMYANRVKCYIQKLKDTPAAINMIECEQAFADINFAIFLYNTEIINTRPKLSDEYQEKFKLYRLRRQLNILMGKRKESYKDHLIVLSEYEKICAREKMALNMPLQMQQFYYEHHLATDKFELTDPEKAIELHSYILSYFTLAAEETNQHKHAIKKLTNQISIEEKTENLSIDEIFKLLELDSKEDKSDSTEPKKKKKKKKKKAKPQATNIESPVSPSPEPIKVLRSAEEEEKWEARKLAKKLKKVQIRTTETKTDSPKSTAVCLIEENLPPFHKNLARFINRLFTKLKEAGATQCYIVGGLPRFLAENRDGSFTGDIDIVTDAKLEDIERAFLHKGINKENYKKFLVSLKKYYHVDISYSRFLEQKGLENDAAHRDFTIGAIYLDESGKLIDPTLRGLLDFTNRQINTIKPALASFTEDPIRILRAIYFSNKLEFKLSQEIIDAIQPCVHLLKNNPGHANALILKLLSQEPDMAIKNFKSLVEYGIFDALFPEIIIKAEKLYSIVQTESQRLPKPHLSSFYDNLLLSSDVSEDKDGGYSKQINENTFLYFNYFYTQIKGKYYALSKKEFKSMPDNIYSWLHSEIFNEKIALNFKLLSDTKILNKMIEDKIFPESYKEAWERDAAWLSNQFSRIEKVKQPGFCAACLLVSATAGTNQSEMLLQYQYNNGSLFFPKQKTFWLPFINEVRACYPVSVVSTNPSALFTSSAVNADPYEILLDPHSQQVVIHPNINPHKN